MSLFVAAQTAFVEYAGKRVKIIKDWTVARAGHAILVGNEHLFKPLEVHFDVEVEKLEEAAKKKAVVPPLAPPPAKAAQAKPAAAAAVAPEDAEEE